MINEVFVNSYLDVFLETILIAESWLDGFQLLLKLRIVNTWIKLINEWSLDGISLEFQRLWETCVKGNTIKEIYSEIDVVPHILFNLL